MNKIEEFFYGCAISIDYAMHGDETRRKYKAYEKIKKTIFSCKTIRQDLACDRMIELFHKKFKDYGLTRELNVISFGQSLMLTVL